MTLDKTPETIQTMFNMISDKYDFINNIMSLGTQKIIKRKCIKELDIKPYNNILDVCCGTGDLCHIIKKIHPEAKITGVDFSEKMLKIAKDNVEEIQFLQEDATNLPFKDNSFDIVTMGFGLRNIQNSEKAIEEVYRVLKPGGYFLHLDFGEKNIFSKIFDKFILFLIKFLSENSYAYSYLIKSKREFLIPNDLIKKFENKGFILYKRKDFLFKIISCQIMRKN